MTFTAPLNYIRDSDGFTPPTMGGAVAVKFGTVAYTDTTAKTLFTLPKGAVIVGGVVNVSTAFNSGDSALLDLGLAATANALANDLDVDTAGQLVSGFAVAALFAAPLTADTAVTATYIGAGTAANAGAATVAVYYVMR